MHWSLISPITGNRTILVSKWSIVDGLFGYATDFTYPKVVKSRDRGG